MNRIELRQSLGMSYAAARRCLLFEPETVLGSGRPAAASTFTGKVGDVEVSVPVKVSVGRFAENDDPRSCSREVHVQAETHSGWFPTLEGFVRVEESKSLTDVLLVGDVHPPGGPLGRAVHAARLHRVAEMSMSRYLGTVVDRMRQSGDAHDGLTGVPM